MLVLVNSFTTLNLLLFRTYFKEGGREGDCRCGGGGGSERDKMSATAVAAEHTHSAHQLIKVEEKETK